MASAITLLKSFATGNGVGATSYFAFAPDHDSNYTIIETAFNTLIAEFSAINGPNAALVLDLVQAGDTATPGGQALNGVVGAHSFVVTVPGSQTVRLSAGTALVAGLRTTAALQNLSTAAFTGPDTLWVNIDQVGVASLQTSAGAVANSLDIATIDIDGAEEPQIGTLVYLAPVFFDGDQYQRLLRTDGNASAGVPTETHRSLDDRISNLERLLRGLTTNASGGTALGPLGLMRGSAATPGLITSNGSTHDVGTGWFRVAADEVGLSINTSRHLHWVEDDMAFERAIRSDPETVAYNAGTTEVDFSLSNGHHLTFGAGNITTLDILNPQPGQWHHLVITQDGTGGRTIGTWDAAIIWAGGGTPPTLSSAGGAVDLVEFYVQSTGVILAWFTADFQ